jgi:DNA-binding transcriptional LysR family regulator
MNKLDLRRAAAFHAVVRAGGINAAARMEGRSPPSVHADLRRFEEHIGVPLMERIGRRLRPTPEGLALFGSIDRALTEIGYVAGQVRHGTPALLPLRIACVTGFGRYRLAPALFAAADATQQIILRTGSHEDVIGWLASGASDFGITYKSVVATPIESTAFAEEELWLVGQPPAEITLDSMTSMPCVTYDEYEYVFARWFDDAFGAQPPRLTHRDRCNELEEALTSVRAGRGFTIAPEDACRAYGFVRPAIVSQNTLMLCTTGDRLASDSGKWLSQLGSSPT